jgi:hypothetical protein
LHVIKSKMEWTSSFKGFFEAAAPSLDEDDDDRNFSTVGAELHLDHAIVSREPSGVLYTDDYEIEPPQIALREPSGLLYTDENEIESPQISFAMSDLQYTRTNSIVEDPHPLDDVDQENVASLVAPSIFGATSKSNC